MDDSELERSLQNFSINDQHQNLNSCNSSSSGGKVMEMYAGKIRSSSSVSGGSSSTDIVDPSSSIELRSETPLPYFWEQCLDLKTGGVYYINWRTGMRSEDDPRTNPDVINNTKYNTYSSEEEEDDDDSCSYDSEGYTSSYSDHSSPPLSVVSNEKDLYVGGDEAEGEQQILVVTGCKNCFMYFMVPKQVEECPKCCGQLLHFDR